MNTDNQASVAATYRPAYNQRISELQATALRLKKEKDTLVLSHLYQRPEIQDIADMVGDSLGLSQAAARTDNPIIVFCGVHFMAESAKILSPDKTVVLPEAAAGCQMADMISLQGLREMKAKHPGVPVVCYVNSSAALKAESDICCTSRNAVKVVESVDSDTVLFIPDRNLAAYVATKTSKKVIPWEGFCPTHEHIRATDVKRLQKEHPDAPTMVHPECTPEVIALADRVFSTQGMINFAKENPAKTFIVGTEVGILHQLKKDNPDKTFLFPSEKEQICPNMKATTLQKVVWALEKLEPQVTVPEDIRLRAVHALERMLAIG